MRLAKILVPVATLVAAALAWAQSSVRPGQYEVTSETRIPGEATATQSTDLDCITPEEAEDLQATLVELVSEDTCGVSNVESSPGKMTFDSDCEGIVSHVEITFSAETIALVLTMTIEGQTTTSTAQAKWIGATCAAEDE
jgi:hypothetical protein